MTPLINEPRRLHVVDIRTGSSSRCISCRHLRKHPEARPWPIRMVWIALGTSSNPDAIPHLPICRSCLTRMLSMLKRSTKK
jgi:hypothetical protein